jgi:hypothetical protein
MILRANQNLTRLFAALLGLPLILSVTTVFAQQKPGVDVPYQLRWDRDPGAESCISAQSLSRYLAQIVGSPNVTTGTYALALEGRAQRAKAPNQFQIQLRVLDAQGELIGERLLSTPKARCSALNSALLLVLSMAINPNGETASIPTTIAEELNSENQPEPDSNGDETIEVTTANATELSRVPLLSTVSLTKRTFLLPELTKRHWFLFGGAALSTRVVPKPTLGFITGMRRDLPFALSASLAFAIWVPRAAHIENPWTLPGEISVGAAQLRGLLCHSVLERSAVELRACAGGHWGFRWFSTDTLKRQYLSTQSFYGPSTGMEGKFPVSSRLSLLGTIHLAVQFPRDRFTYISPMGDKQSLYRPALFAGDAFVGIEATL